jgi:hypothetical protein
VFNAFTISEQMFQDAAVTQIDHHRTVKGTTSLLDDTVMY